MKHFAALALIAVTLSGAQARSPCSSDLPVASTAADVRVEALTAFYTVPRETTTETEVSTDNETDYSTDMPTDASTTAYEATTTDEVTETYYDDTGIFEGDVTTGFGEPMTTATSDYTATDYEEDPYPTTTATNDYSATSGGYDDIEVPAESHTDDYTPSDSATDLGYGGYYPTATTTAEYAPTEDSGYGAGPATTDEAPAPDNGADQIPHSDEVLLEYWRGAGCTTDFPVNEGPGGWWRNHELVIVENDMQLWYEYATEGEPTYQAACFGNKGDLLMQWWREAGCTTDFPLGEKPEGFWHVHTEEVVRADMAQWYENAVNGDPLYEAACKPNSEAPAPAQGQ